jgi:predicted TIM-barrel fold metal-dependent hydrolase
MTPERIVDFHVHVGFSTNYAIHPPGRAIETMRAAGFAGAVIFPFERGTQESYRASNDRVLRAARRWPGFCPFARTGIRDIEASLDELARAVEAGAKGLKIHPLFDRVDPRAKETARLLEAARKHGLTVLVHTNKGENSHPNDWAPHIRDMPDVDFVLGHAGFYEYRSALEVICRHANAYVETSLCSGLMLEKIAEFGVPSRVLFGTDYPYGDTTTSFLCMRDAIVRTCGDRAEEVMRAVFHENAERLLRRRFDAPLPKPDVEPDLALRGHLVGADGSERACTVYQISDANCSFVLDERDTAPLGDVTRIRLTLARESFDAPVRLLFGNGARWSVGFVDASARLLAAIVALHLEIQDASDSREIAGKG